MVLRLVSGSRLCMQPRASPEKSKTVILDGSGEEPSSCVHAHKQHDKGQLMHRVSGIFCSNVQAKGIRAQVRTRACVPLNST